MDDRTLTGSPADRFPLTWLHALSVPVFAWLAVRLFLWGGWGAGFALLVLLTQVMVFIWYLLPARLRPA